MDPIDFAEWILYRYTPVTTGVKDNPWKEIKKWYSDSDRCFYSTEELYKIYCDEKR